MIRFVLSFIAGCFVMYHLHDQVAQILGALS